MMARMHEQDSTCARFRMVVGRHESAIANCQLLIAFLRHQHSHRQAVIDFSIGLARVEIKSVAEIDSA